MQEASQIAQKIVSKDAAKDSTRSAFDCVNALAATRSDPRVFA
jgi:hypothetical protein